MYKKKQGQGQLDKHQKNTDDKEDIDENHWTEMRKLKMKIQIETKQ